LIQNAVGNVRSRGVDWLPGLLLAARDRYGRRLYKTDLPMALAPLAFAIVSQADVSHARRTVFQPRTFATAISGYRNILKMAACRAWIANNFPPKTYYGTWVPPEPTPTPTPTPTPMPTP
jgi:hypothetical protein